MRPILALWAVALVGCLLLSPGGLSAQQVTVGTPYHAVNESFFENMGTSWGLRGPNWNLSVNASPTQAAPQFGGFDPSAGLSFGLGFNRGGMSGGFNANFSQGSRRSFVSQTPVVTLQNGVPGTVSDTTQSPFVVGFIPVVGGRPMVGPFMPPIQAPPPVYVTPYYNTGHPAVLGALQRARQQRQAREGSGLETVPTMPEQPIEQMGPAVPQAPPRRPRPDGINDDLVLVDSPSEATETADAPGVLGATGQSSAARPAPSVAVARQLHVAEQRQHQEEALAFLERGRNAETTGKANVARLYYQMAYRRADGQLRQQIAERLRLIESEAMER